MTTTTTTPFCLECATHQRRRIYERRMMWFAIVRLTLLLAALGIAAFVQFASNIRDAVDVVMSRPYAVTVVCADGNSSITVNTTTGDVECVDSRDHEAAMNEVDLRLLRSFDALIFRVEERRSTTAKETQ